MYQVSITAYFLDKKLTDLGTVKPGFTLNTCRMNKTCSRVHERPGYWGTHDSFTLISAEAYRGFSREDRASGGDFTRAKGGNKERGCRMYCRAANIAYPGGGGMGTTFLRGVYGVSGDGVSGRCMRGR